MAKSKRLRLSTGCVFCYDPDGAWKVAQPMVGYVTLQMLIQRTSSPL